MVKFRRSIKSSDNKADLKPQHISIPPKDAIAIVPPKKVRIPSQSLANAYHYLSFTQGDFLHVVGRENDPDWYEACNPLHGTRGLVPVKYFDIVGKTVRDSGGSVAEIGNLPSAGHDSGYAEKTSAEHDAKPLRISKSMKGTGAMVYGVVMYDFKAERPDELEAKEGEAIIVIAQSNPEWFVAKPITRLGGPGLIPVSFIEIRDMTTGQAVPDPHEAVRAAGVPRVEEWKKMAAEYKNGSIPLGKLDANTPQTQQGADRTSTRSNGANGYNGNVGAIRRDGQWCADRSPQSHSRAGSAAQNYGYRKSHEPEPQPKLAAPVSASVPRYCFANDIFWFIVECQMEDGTCWELSRLYQDFYDLQIKLINAFPLEAGQVEGVERTLPYMPGPVTYVTDNITNGRRANLDDYIKNLLKLGPHVTRSDLVCQFFRPRNDDYEIDPTVSADGYRLSGASQQSATDHSAGASRQSSTGNLRGSNHTRQVSKAQSLHPHQSHASHGSHPSHQSQPPMKRNNSAITQSSMGSNQGGTGVGAHKIKVWLEEDNCVVIRMPAYFRFGDLYKKLQERRALENGGKDALREELLIEYRDEADGIYYPIENDASLEDAIARCPKLVLWVSPTQ
ncbi:scaffold protein Scd2 [Phyllosticta citribraziliensis]